MEFVVKLFKIDINSFVKWKQSEITPKGESKLFLTFARAIMAHVLWDINKSFRIMYTPYT